MQQKDFKLNVLGTGRWIHATELEAMMEDREFLDLFANQLKQQVNQYLDQEREGTLFFQVYDLYWREQCLSTTLATGFTPCFETGQGWWFVATLSEEGEELDRVESLPYANMETRKVAHWMLNHLLYFSCCLIQEECRMTHWLPSLVNVCETGETIHRAHRRPLKQPLTATRGKIIPFPVQS